MTHAERTIEIARSITRAQNMVDDLIRYSNTGVSEYADQAALDAALAAHDWLHALKAEEACMR